MQQLVCKGSLCQAFSDSRSCAFVVSSPVTASSSSASSLSPSPCMLAARSLASDGFLSFAHGSSAAVVLTILNNSSTASKSLKTLLAQKGVTQVIKTDALLLVLEVVLVLLLLLLCFFHYFRLPLFLPVLLLV